MKPKDNLTRELAPIALFVFNRPWHTRQMLEALQKNEFASESDLIVFCDGPRSEQEVAIVEETRQYLRTIQGFRNIRIIEHKQNLGLANNIIAGVTRTVAEFGRVIVMEDDLVTSPFFLRYMNDGLRFYEKEERVISIHGYVYPTRAKLPETFFIKGADCWGWATWKRGWDLFERDGSLLLSELQKRGQTSEFDFGDTGYFTKMLKDQIAGKNNSWAIRWNASAFLRDKLTLYPGRSLVLNIGTDGSGTHGKAISSFGKDLAQSPIPVSTIPVEDSFAARKAFEAFFRERQGSLLLRLLRKMRRFLCF